MDGPKYTEEDLQAIIKTKDEELKKKDEEFKKKLKEKDEDFAAALEKQKMLVHATAYERFFSGVADALLRLVPGGGSGRVS
eukprot:tig00001424_g8702.t1